MKFRRQPTARPLDVILIGYTAPQTERALSICDQILTGIPVASRILVLNNSRQPEPTRHGWTTLRGSNELGEFSAWHEGLALRGSGERRDVLFANDTLGKQRRPSIFRRWALRREMADVGDGAVLVNFTGQRVAPNAAMHIGGLPLHRWMSSYCFLVTAAALDLLGGKLYDPDEIASCVHGGPHERTFFTDRVSPALRAHLTWWLFQGWHRSEALTPESQERLALKARCICAELLLSARCQSLGAESRDPLERHPVARFLDRANSVRWALLTGA